APPRAGATSERTAARAPAGKVAPPFPAPGAGAPPRRAAGSLIRPALPLVQEAPDERAVHLVQLGRLHLAAVKHLGAARGEPAARRDADQVGGGSRGSGERSPGGPDRWARFQRARP